MAKNDFLTRARAIEVITQEGGSVLIGNTLYTKVEDLPSEAEFAAGNPDYAEQAKRTLQYQLQDIQRQLALLEETGTATGRDIQVEASTAAKMANAPKPAGTTAEEASDVTRAAAQERESAPATAYGKSTKNTGEKK